MNLDEIKNRLDRLNNKGGGSSNDYKNNFWRNLDLDEKN